MEGEENEHNVIKW